ncbi:HNH endonuclease [Gordonia sp. DT218]|uniref:HNH endonuclease n=1 Tax=Gordonia sp. DT218 TaxID=3416659 RepID=UPI003CFA800D
MAELGETSDPKELIPGDAAAIDENALAIGGRGNSMALAGTSLQGINTGDYWDGSGAEAFREVFKQEPVKWLTAADAFINTGNTLGQYAGVVRWAQGQAQGAIDKYNEAQRATEQAIADYNAAVTSANATNTANAADGNPVRVTVPPFHDPGIEGREAAEAMLAHARQQLKEAGDTAAGNVRSQQAHAPKGPHKRSGIWDYIKEVGGGIGDWGTGSWGALKSLFTTNPVDSVKGIWNAVSQDPKQFGKDLVDWDTWAENPARAAGRVIPDAALTVATAGVGSVARRGAAESVEAGVDAADAASAVPKGPSLAMKYKDTWTDAQRAEMDRKLDTFNEKVKDDGFQRQPGPFVRDPNVRTEFLQSQGLSRPPTGLQVDHIQDLQAGGADDVSNLQLLDASVNTSFGSQLRNLMSQHPPGTVFGAVEMLRE